MGAGEPEAKFSPVEWKILPEWYVLVAFADGKKLRISGAFKTEAEATAWIAASAAKWLKEHHERKRG